MSASSDDGYNSGEECWFEQMNFLCNKAHIAPENIGPVFCRNLAFAKVDGTLLCMSCYSRGDFGVCEITNTHSSHNMVQNLREHGRCGVCSERLWHITPKGLCLICNKI